MDAIGDLFDLRDPCFNNLAFSLCQRYYLTRLMGLDLPIDFLSDQIYRNTIFFLDTNFVCTVALSKANQHNEFKTLLDFAPKLGITFAVCDLSIAEMQNKVGQYRSF